MKRSRRCHAVTPKDLFRASASLRVSVWTDKRKCYFRLMS
jgi:hypothetical protein